MRILQTQLSRWEGHEAIRVGRYAMPLEQHMVMYQLR
jgi:hypothetical protein